MVTARARRLRLPGANSRPPRVYLPDSSVESIHQPLCRHHRLLEMASSRLPQLPRAVITSRLSTSTPPTPSPKSASAPILFGGETDSCAAVVRPPSSRPTTRLPHHARRCFLPIVTLPSIRSAPVPIRSAGRPGLALRPDWRRVRPDRTFSTSYPRPPHAAVNFYLTQADGAVVGQHRSAGHGLGTNDKACSALNLSAGSLPHDQGDLRAAYRLPFRTVRT